MRPITAARTVAVSTGHNGYPFAPPYSPETRYPEYPFGDAGLPNGANPAYDGVRDALRLLNLDTEHYGRPEWNPLGDIVRPGDTAVLKPNFVRDFRETHSGLDDCVITHGSVIRAAVDYVYIALGGRGHIIIADAPQNDADFDAIRRLAGLDGIQKFYRRHAGFKVEVCDLRSEAAEKIDGVIVGHRPLPGDPTGYVKVNLGARSALAEVNHLCHLLYGSEYDTREVRSHHHDDVHEYLISKTILGADCVINLPKLKTHKKTGITVCMKNLVGINGNKNWLPHHREGTPAQGGDQFADDGFIHRIERRAVAGFKQVFPRLGRLRQHVAGPVKALGQAVFGETNRDTVRSGNWHGNDTTWRMVIDLNRILQYADAEGKIHDRPVRQVFSIADSIVAGEGNGPLDPKPRQAGIILAGINPVAVDLACCHLMGFCPQRIPLLSRAALEHPLPLAPFTLQDVVAASNDPQFCGRVMELPDHDRPFDAPFGWRSHLEVVRNQ